MTKLKSKKMSKSTFAVIIMAILMVAMLAFGGTYAYFTANVGTAIDASATTGRIKLTTTDTFTLTTTVDITKILPSETLVDFKDESFEVTDASNRASYIFFQYSVKVYPKVDIYNANNGEEQDLTKATGSEYAEQPLTVSGFSNALTADDIKATTNTDTLKAVALDGYAGVFVVTTTDDVREDGAVTTAGTYGDTFTVTVKDVKIPNDWDNRFQEAKIEVVFSVESIQVAGTTDAPTAWSTHLKHGN